MYNQSYEEYMRSVLGYSMNNTSSCGCNTYENSVTPSTPAAYINNNVTPSNVQVACMVNLDEMYPDIYKIVYPMVCKICDSNTKPITREVIQEMVEVIYSSIETDETENRSKPEVELKNGDVRNPNVKSTEKRETRQIRPNNYLLRDLITILLLNRLGGGRPPRPPFPGGPRPPVPPRPPFPGGPGPVRPPVIQPRDYNDYVQF